jgi:hypothetical protein
LSPCITRGQAEDDLGSNTINMTTNANSIQSLLGTRTLAVLMSGNTSHNIISKNFTEYTSGNAQMKVHTISKFKFKLVCNFEF